MATLHNKAGQFCKGQAQKRVKYVFVGVAAFMALMGAGVVCLWLYRQRWQVAGLGLAGLGALYLFQRLLDKPLDAIARERIKYMRGGQAEALVAWLLADLEGDWHVFNNVELVKGSDVDHVLVGPGGLFCISTKSLRGLFTCQANGEVCYNNEPTRLISDTTGRAVELKKRLSALMGEDVPYVVAVLAVPFCYVEAAGAVQDVLILHQENLVETLEKRRRTLSSEQIARCVKALTDLASDARDTYRRPRAAMTVSPKMESVEPRQMV